MDKVVVLMSTYNGEKYLEEQLRSIFAQKDVAVEVFARDDGSKDRSLEILKMNNCACEAGDNVGYIDSFMWLIRNAPSSEYYALSDQDDVWDENKLIAAINMMKKGRSDAPQLHTCVVASDSGANPEILKNEKYGLLYKSGNP